MRGHLKRNSFILYGVAIASVIVLFKVVTIYGETNLKARPNIDGRYRLVGVKMAECTSEKPLILTIQQSGVYLNGNLSTSKTKSNSALKEKLPLKGKIEGDKLHFSGILPAKQICSRGVANASQNEELLTDIQASFLESSAPTNQPVKLAGQLTIDKITNKIDFTTAPYSTDSNAPSH